MRKYLLLLGLCAGLAAFTGCAGDGDPQSLPQRYLPFDGQRGTVGAAQPLPQVQIGKQIMRLAPGAVIHDQGNRWITHSQLKRGAEVLFTRDQTGNVTRIYILTDDEKARLAAAGRR